MKIVQLLLSINIFSKYIPHSCIQKGHINVFLAGL